MRLTDRVTGPLLVALGGLAAYGGSRLPAVPGQDVGPAAFPMMIGFGLMICGTLIFLGVGQSFEVPDEAEEPGHRWAYGLRALIPFALLLFYVLAVERAGFLLTGFVIIGAGVLALGGRLRLALPVAVLATCGIHAVFANLLRVPLPDGILPAPW